MRKYLLVVVLVSLVYLSGCIGEQSSRFGQGLVSGEEARNLTVAYMNSTYECTDFSEYNPQPYEEVVGFDPDNLYVWDMEVSCTNTTKPQNLHLKVDTQLETVEEIG